MNDPLTTEQESLPSDCRALSMGLLIVLNHMHHTSPETHRAYVESAREALRRAANEIERLRQHKCSLPDSIQEALNSGDGVYRP